MYALKSQAATEPSEMMAAMALSVAWMALTFLGVLLGGFGSAKEVCGFRFASILQCGSVWDLKGCLVTTVPESKT